MYLKFHEIVARADEVKARKQAEYEALMNRAYRDGELSTSQFSDPNHQSSVDDYGGKIQDSLRTRETEHNGLKLADSKIARPESVYSPVDQEPNKYKSREGKSRCSHCKRWKPVDEFSPKKRANGNVFLSSWCKACRNEHAAEMYREAQSLKRFA